MQVRKLRRELADAKEKVHTLTTQLTTNVSNRYNLFPRSFTLNMLMFRRLSLVISLLI